MKIREIMTTKVITAKPEESIKDVILRLRRYKVHGLPVIEDNKVIGVFSESGIMNMMPDILHEAEQIPLLDIKELTDQAVGEVMFTPPYTIGPDNDIKEAAKIFLEKYVHRLPVVENDELIGVVSLGDVLKAYMGE